MRVPPYKRCDSFHILKMVCVSIWRGWKIPDVPGERASLPLCLTLYLPCETLYRAHLCGFGFFNSCWLMRGGDCRRCQSSINPVPLDQPLVACYGKFAPVLLYAYMCNHQLWVVYSPFCRHFLSSKTKWWEVAKWEASRLIKFSGPVFKIKVFKVPPTSSSVSWLSDLIYLLNVTLQTALKG